jgi:hypothetical protein
VSLIEKIKIDVHVLSGMAMIMTATPTNAAHPRRSYKETKAIVICADQEREIQIYIDNFT